MEIINSTNSSQPLLTIAIPTYNRASYLDLCLSRISEEIDSLNEDQRYLVIVYVSDNASEDNTPQVISEYQSLISQNIKTVRNIINIGADQNIAKCYETAITPYVWIFGDDDVLLPGRLCMVLNTLLKQEVDILYVNNYGFNNNYAERPTHQEKHGVSKFDEPLRFVQRTNVMLTFISALIVRSNVGLEFRSELLTSNLVQFSWVLPLLRDGKCFSIIEDFVVAAKSSNSNGYALVQVFGVNLIKITDDILKNQPKVAKTIQNGTIVNFFPSFILEFRNGASNFADKNMAENLKNTFDDNWRYYAFLLPLIVLPLPLAHIYHTLLRVFRRLFRSFLV